MAACGDWAIPGPAAPSADACGVAPVAVCDAGLGSEADGIAAAAGAGDAAPGLLRVAGDGITAAGSTAGRDGDVPGAAEGTGSPRATAVAVCMRLADAGDGWEGKGSLLTALLGVALLASLAGGSTFRNSGMCER